MKKILLIIFIALLLLSPKAFAKNSEAGYFEVINAAFSIKGVPLKLNDGRILFGIQTIFDPKTNTYSKTKYYDEKLNYNLEYRSGIVLKDDRVMFFNPISKISTKDKQSEVYYNKSLHVNIYDPKKDELEICAKNIETRGLNSKILLKDGRVLLIYGDYPDYYRESLAFIPSDIFIYNPNTDKFTPVENKSKLALCNPVLLNDGRALFRENKENRIVIYNPKDSSFFISKHKIGTKSIVLNSDRIFSLYSEQTGKYSYNREYFTTVYNPMTDDALVQGRLIEIDDFFKLNDGRILVFADNTSRRAGAYIYNIEKNEFQKIKKLKTHRYSGHDIVLKDDSILRFSGYKYVKHIGYNPILDILGFYSPIDEYKTELFNPNTGKSYFVKNKYGKNEHLYTGLGFYNILLDDGRLFIKFMNQSSGRQAVIYTPKGYRAD